MYDDFSSGRFFSAKHWKKELAPVATVASIGIGMLPVIGSLYDAYSLWLGRDPLTGAPLSKAEMGLIAAGIVGGFIGLGFLDEAGDIGKGIVKGVGSVDEIADAAKSARYVDDIADAAKGLGRVDEVIDVAKNLDNIDEAIDEAIDVVKNLDNVDEALDVTRNLDELEDAVNTAADLSRADELGDTTRLSDELDEVTLGRTDSPEGSNFGDVCDNSFTADTVVQTDEGEKPIEEVAVGDKVFAEDPETGEQDYFEVVALTNHPETDILRVIVESEVEDPAAPAAPDQSTVDTDEKSGDNETEQPNTEISSMEITPGHPVYVEDEGWLNAENLTEGDRLRRADGGYAKVLAVERVELDEPQEVYNFTVKGPHTYFVLSSGVLVHNVQCDPPWKNHPDIEHKPGKYESTISDQPASNTKLKDTYDETIRNKENEITKEIRTTKVEVTKTEIKNGEEVEVTYTGSFHREYYPGEEPKLVMKNAERDPQISRIQDPDPLLPGGTPTGAYVTMNQMNKMGIKPGTLKKVEMKNVVDFKTTLQWNWLSKNKKNLTTEEFQQIAEQLHSVHYAKTPLIQSGHRIKPGTIKVDVAGADHTPIGATPKIFGQRYMPENVDIDEMIAKYGFKDTDEVDWGINISFEVEKAPGTP